MSTQKPVDPISVMLLIVCIIGLSMYALPVLANALKHHKNPPILTDTQFADTAKYAVDNCEKQFKTKCNVTAAPIPRIGK